MARNSKNKRYRSGFRNAVTVGSLTFFISLFFSGATQGSLEAVSMTSVVFILGAIIGIALIGDIIGVAVTAAKESPFHAMASKRVPGARECVYLVRNNERVNSFFTDIIGDVCGTVSGALAPPLIFNVRAMLPHLPVPIISMVVIGLIAALTVGAKAWTKGFSIRNATTIVGIVGKTLYWAKRLLPLPRKFSRSH